MTMVLGRGGRMLALAMAGLAMSAAPAVEIADRRADGIVRRQRREIPTARTYGIVHGYRNGPGWTAAHVQRMATKARNRRRHKIAAKRKGGA